MAPAPEQSTEWLGWYFSRESERLRYDDGRKIKVGITHTVDGEPIPCVRGLHASPTVLRALDYAPGPILWRVRLSGTRVDQSDKSCATARTYLARIDATDILRAFARRCALDVIHLWDAPRIVREYLETGNEDLRAAARAAAWAAVRDAAWDAACADASDAAAAWAAARAGAGDAASAAAAASGAARGAGWVATRRAQEQRLDSMVMEALERQDAAVAAAEGRSDG